MFMETGSLVMIHIQQITSIKDERVVEARELTSASGRMRLRKIQLEGTEGIQWALEARLTVEHIFYSANLRQHDELTPFQGRGIPCYAVSDGILKKISDTSYLVPIIGIAQLPAERAEQEASDDFVLVLDRVQDHGNLGTIIRTASAFGIRELVSTTPDVDIYFKKVVSASRGKTFEASLRKFSLASEAITALKQRGYQIVATSPYARDIQSMAPLQQKPVALVVGNETEGIADDVMKMADVVVQIPMSGLVESLNVGVATGISLYELKFRMVLTMLVNHIRANFGREVNATGQMIMQAFNHTLQKVTDLTSLQVVLLMMLACDRQMTRMQAGRDTATFGAELDALLQPLLDRQYITIQQSDNDETLHITPEGERTIAQLWSVVEKSENEVLAGFTEQEKQQLNSYLKRIQSNCASIVE
jgi:TrmH family RNA methyltransferase